MLVGWFGFLASVSVVRYSDSCSGCRMDMPEDCWAEHVGLLQETSGPGNHPSVETTNPGDFLMLPHHSAAAHHHHHEVCDASL